MTIAIGSTTSCPILEPASSLPPAVDLTQKLTTEQLEAFNTLSKTLLPTTLSTTSLSRELAEPFCNVQCLLRYLRAHSYNPTRAAEALSRTLTWRHTYSPHTLSPDSLASEARQGNNYVNGFDKKGRPIVYLKKRGMVHDPHKNVQLLVLVVEQAIKLMPPGVEQLVILMDMSEYTWANRPPSSVTKETLHILTAHYPERLGKCFMVNAPWIFGALWKVVSPFLDSVTKDKIRFVSCDAQTDKGSVQGEAEILEVIDPEMLESAYGGMLHFAYDHEAYWDAMQRKRVDETS